MKDSISNFKTEKVLILFHVGHLWASEDKKAVNSGEEEGEERIRTADLLTASQAL